MPVLNVRNVPEALMKQLKVDAATNGITLREHVLTLLGHPHSVGRVSRVAELEKVPMPEPSAVITALGQDKPKKHGKHFMDTW